MTRENGEAALAENSVVFKIGASPTFFANILTLSSFFPVAAPVAGLARSSLELNSADMFASLSASAFAGEVKESAILLRPNWSYQLAWPACFNIPASSVIHLDGLIITRHVRSIFGSLITLPICPSKQANGVKEFVACRQ
mmetsp:Transcript_51205/g.159958  ORF Transcript_51205/g.159958 Transcript_51205/m.159958 type:complete len:140 (-) Transcript_51205:156-575(-)